MTQLYRNTRAWRVRFLHVLFWAASLGFVVLALLGGPDPNSWIVGAILAPILALFALGMEWYLRCYVTALEAQVRAHPAQYFWAYNRWKRARGLYE